MSRKLMSAVALAALIALAACGGEAPPPAQQQKPQAQATPPAAEPAAGGGEAGEYQVVAVADGGTISGKVTATGNVPKPEKVEVNKDNAVCGSEKTMEDIVAGADGSLGNAVVWIDAIGKGKAWNDGQQGAVDQRECHYVPQIQVLAPGASLDVINSDPILHNIHAYSGEETLFNIAQPIKGQKTTKKLTASGPVHFKCDVHSWMSAWVFVAASPYFAVTKADGTFSIGDVPPGTYTVKVWHGRLGESSTSVKVDPKGTASANLEIHAS
jgi:plastocyanin/predicted small lipoprotein YifL